MRVEVLGLSHFNFGSIIYICIYIYIYILKTSQITSQITVK